jgi:hypothetical protein
MKNDFSDIFVDNLIIADKGDNLSPFLEPIDPTA